MRWAPPETLAGSSNSTLSSGRADSSALTREATGGAGDRAGRKRRRSQSAREHGVDARLELYASDGRLFHLFGRFLLEAAEAFAHAGRFIRDVLSKTRGAAVSAG